MDNFSQGQRQCLPILRYVFALLRQYNNTPIWCPSSRSQLHIYKYSSLSLGFLALFQHPVCMATYHPWESVIYHSLQHKHSFFFFHVFHLIDLSAKMFTQSIARTYQHAGPDEPASQLPDLLTACKLWIRWRFSTSTCMHTKTTVNSWGQHFR